MLNWNTAIYDTPFLARTDSSSRSWKLCASKFCPPRMTEGGWFRPAPRITCVVRFERKGRECQASYSEDGRNDQSSISFSLL